jgi:hypothetical protein
MGTSKKGTADKTNKPPVSKYTKQQILHSARYKERVDLLGALLKDDRTYSHDQLELLINNFLKGTVK